MLNILNALFGDDMFRRHMAYRRPLVLQLPCYVEDDDCDPTVEVIPVENESRNGKQVFKIIITEVPEHDADEDREPKQKRMRPDARQNERLKYMHRKGRGRRVVGRIFND